MNGNYRAKLSSGRTVTAKAHNKIVEIFGVTVAKVDDQFRIKFLETFWDPAELFRQLISEGLEELQEGEKVEGIEVGGECPAGAHK